MTQKNISKDILSNKETLLQDYKIGWQSRHASIIGRKEVLSGKAKFGIFGDGKELPQLALAHFFENGDWRSGYYRDQTLMMALGTMSLQSFFAQLYGNTDLEANPDNGGRLMNNHFATRSLDEYGDWKNLTNQPNSSADISPTAGQMPRLVGLAMASQWFRTESETQFEKFSHNGNEIAFGTIGDASTSEGHFWETLNAAGVMQIPMAMLVWDDGFGISVNIEKQTIKASISEALAGFQRTKDKPGFEIIKVNGWDYPALLEALKKGTKLAREEHIPILFHVVGLTQPQGHSTSGSHERYKSAERLQWEDDFDAMKKFKEYLIQKKIATIEELDQIEKDALKEVKDAKKLSWKAYNTPFLKMRDELVSLSNITSCHCAKTNAINKMMDDLKQMAEPSRKEVISTAKRVLRHFCQSCSPEKSLKKSVGQWLEKENYRGQKLYNDHLYSETEHAALKQKEIPIQYSDQPEMVPGREILRDNFDYILQNNPNALAFGEDVGKIGGVNQTWEGLQEKHGKHRVFDTGIREATIMGQAIGLAMRGLRPIAEIQYFDYLMYALQTISDDLATLRWRTVGGQKAPVIISTRGHRLEGVWHSGSALSMVVNSIRGVHVMVPRNMTQAAGFYNTMIKSDDPGLIIEPLNAYRLREPKPANIGDYTIPLGKPEVLKEGSDITLVTYGSCVRIAEEAIPQLEEMNISVELIDVQTLLPFDINGTIISSLIKTNKIVFFDEDVPGGTTAYMMQQVLEKQDGWNYLDAEPKTITAKDHRPAYGSDGDYFSNPNAENVFDTVYELMHEYNPQKHPTIY